MELVMQIAQSEAHIHEDDLAIYVRGGFDSKRISALEHHLSECEACRETLSQCVGLQIRLQCTGRSLRKSLGGHQRSEPRFETKDDAILQELHPLSFDRRRVKVVNVSQNGIGLVATIPVFPGAIVQIRVGEAVELGEVRHCQQQGDGGYRIGLRLNLPD